jgi:hypothetical protein
MLKKHSVIFGDRRWVVNYEPASQECDEFLAFQIALTASIILLQQNVRIIKKN